MKTKCQRCNKEAVTDFKHLGKLCARCFCSAIEKRIRKYARIHKTFQKGDRIFCKDEINQHLVAKIILGLPVKFLKSKPSATKVIESWTADDESCDQLGHMLLGSARTKHLSIIITCTDAEIIMFSKLKRIRFAPRKKNSDISNILYKLEKKHAETTFSTAKSTEKLDKLM